VEAFDKASLINSSFAGGLEVVTPDASLVVATCLPTIRGTILNPEIIGSQVRLALPFTTPP